MKFAYENLLLTLRKNIPNLTMARPSVTLQYISRSSVKIGPNGNMKQRPLFAIPDRRNEPDKPKS